MLCSAISAQMTLCCSLTQKPCIYKRELAYSLGYSYWLRTMVLCYTDSKSVLLEQHFVFILYAQPFVYPHSVPHRTHCLNSKYQQQKELVGIRKSSRNCPTLSYLTHYWNETINFIQYLTCGSLNLLEPSGPVKACNEIAFFYLWFLSKILNFRAVWQIQQAISVKWSLFCWGLHTKCMGMWHKCACLIRKFEDNRTASLKDLVV
jgi:hypothetical protein